MSDKAKPTLTLAQLYEKQDQLLDALVIYQQLINKEYSEELDDKIKDLKNKIFNDGALEYSPAIDKIFTTEDKKNFKILPHDEYKAFIESQAQHTNEETYPEEILQEKAQKTTITKSLTDDIPESEQELDEEPTTEVASDETEDIISEPELQEEETESFSEIQDESETISIDKKIAPISDEPEMDISDEPDAEMDIGVETMEDTLTVESRDTEIPAEEQISNEDQLDEIQESESETDLSAADEKEQFEDITESEITEPSPEVEPIEEPVKDGKKEEEIEPESETELPGKKTSEVESEIEPIQPLTNIEEKLHTPEGADVLDLLKDLKNIDAESLNNILIENLGEDRTLDEVKLSDVHYALELLKNTDETEE
ncbi:MAG: hypothetical protein ISS80_07560 [Candidatus Cloacimonetes bacterium]|nr:hypothetical protein [Candidatus Cloacimonadota bacterium]MBL7149910.1 hypothetical protein [Candidatus Cloacimonadota bacterium]